jgi:hypothetical protein
MEDPLDEEESSTFQSILKAAQAIINGTRHPGEPLNVDRYDEFCRKINQHIEHLEIDLEQRVTELTSTEQQLSEKTALKKQYLESLSTKTPYKPSWDGTKRIKVLSQICITYTTFVLWPSY